MAGEIVVIDGVRYRADDVERLGLGAVEELVVTTAQVAPAPVETTQTLITTEPTPPVVPVVETPAAPVVEPAAAPVVQPAVEPAPVFEPPTPLAPPVEPVAPETTPVKESSDGVEPRGSKRPRNAARSTGK